MTLAALLTSAFFAAPVGWLLVLRGGANHAGLAALLPAALFIAVVLLPGGPALIEHHSWVPSLGLSFDLALDGFARLFALLVTGIGTLVVLYATSYFSEAPRAGAARFVALILVFQAAMLGTVLSESLVALFLFWELTGLVSFLLIAFDPDKPETRRVALQSLIVTAGGGLALLAGIILIAQALGTVSMSEIALRGEELAASPLAPAILVLVLIGAFTKSAQVPFQFWLPNAMAAPSPASAYLHSATMVKLGVYLLARLDAPFSMMPAFGPTLMTVGALTMVAAVLGGLTRPGLKAVLAHSTVGSLGLLVLLIGLEGALATTAMVAFLVSHALYKAALFFAAGTMIHATGEGDLARLGGLARSLPLTGLAAGLAALAMAGLPPSFAFIAKEAVFEAQLGAGVSLLIVAVTVLGSALFVAVALMVAAGPFRGRDPASPIRHKERAGLVIGPLLLGGLGLVGGLVPGVFGDAVIGPAAQALGSPPITLYLWHGFTPMLGLSLLAVALGAGLHLLAPRVRDRLAERGLVDALIGDRAYEKLFGGVLAVARRVTKVLQNGDRYRYGVIVAATTILVVATGLAVARPAWSLSFDPSGLDPVLLVVLLVMVAGALAAARSASLLGALIGVGLVGFGSALIFLRNGAPDLAFTQFSVEVLIVVILAGLLLAVKLRPADPSRSLRERGVSLVIAAAFAVIVFAALAPLDGLPLDRTLSDYFSEASYVEAFGRNVVNVILVDFRAIDTLGEIAVVAFAAIGAWGLLRRRAGRGTR